MARVLATVLAVVALCCAFSVPAASAQSSIKLEPVLDGLRQPVFVTHAGDGSGRLFVVERPGRIQVLVNGQPQTFLDMTELVNSGGQEQGLLGLAFHPQYKTNGTFFVAYTARRNSNADTVARYRVSSDPNRADPASATILIEQPDRASNHNGGMLAFGPDGYLYFGTGDEGGANDQFRNAQDLSSLLGKLLRLDVDRGDPYAIPAGNPFASQSGARPEIFALGLRNPWRWSFDRATGDLWIGDVGQGAWEEVDYVPAGQGAGLNFGWNRMEGAHCRSGTCDQGGLTLPVAEYRTADGCAVVGGYRYHGSVADLQGAYVFGDYCSGQMWTLRESGGTWNRAPLLDSHLSLSSFGEDEAGELYAVDLGGRVVRFGGQVGAPSPAPGGATFVLGFAQLKSALGDVMGSPTENEHGNPELRHPAVDDDRAGLLALLQQPAHLRRSAGWAAPLGARGRPRRGVDGRQPRAAVDGDLPRGRGW